MGEVSRWDRYKTAKQVGATMVDMAKAIASSWEILIKHSEIKSNAMQVTGHHIIMFTVVSIILGGIK